LLGIAARACVHCALLCVWQPVGAPVAAQQHQAVTASSTPIHPSIPSRNTTTPQHLPLLPFLIVHSIAYPALFTHPTLPPNDTPHTLITPSTNLTAAMPGFDFSNHNRNVALHAQGVPLPKATSTGTTIVGCLFEGGVVIAADTRATSGPIVADKVHTKSQPQNFKMKTNFGIRTARNFTTSLRRSGVLVRVPPPIPNSQLP